MRKRKERFSTPAEEGGEEDDPNDPRVARKMRNRQSAQRSRQKRQQYTDQLEAEVAQLKRDKEELAIRMEEMQSAQPALTAEQLGLLDELRRQVAEFKKRESKLQIPPPKPLKRHHTTPC
mmetsp:Transcript_9981/g.28660  ORF Transcript_9981/g.28660 Transcript_9981/m.28660 type:complete len:120 (+) Transcript_9981:1116-1475(+)